MEPHDRAGDRFHAISTDTEPPAIVAPPTAMNMQINRFNNTQMEPAPAPRIPVQARAPGRPLDQTSRRDNSSLVPTASIDAQAGVREGLNPRRASLGQRMPKAVRAPGTQQRYVPLRRSRGGKTEKKEVHEEDSAFLAPVRDALDLLSEDCGRDSQEELEAQLERFFEPLQRYNVLFEALQQLENEDIPARKKNFMRRALNSMMSRLMEKNPHEMRKALQETDELANAVDTMAEDIPTSVRDLRFLIGAKSKGNSDVPLTPLVMLKALIKNFGADKCLGAMNGLRSRMMEGF